MASTARALVLGLMLWFCTTVVAGAAEPGQQVLVLLRLAPAHLHDGAGYGGAYSDGAGLAARRRIAERLAREHGLSLITGWPMSLVGVDCYVMAVPAGQTPAKVADDLARDPSVAWSEAMHTYRGQAAVTPSDPLFRLQPAARDWRLADLHELATGRNVRVAVIDSMIDRTHPDLVGRFAGGENFMPDRPGAPEQHGTGVAGIIAAAENGVGMVGVAPEARLMPLRACWQPTGSAATVCDTLSLARALTFAIEHRAQVINLSLSGPPDLLLGRLLDVAMARRIVVVGAVDPERADGGFPASHGGVVAVTDDPRDGGLAGAFLAPGRDIPTTEPGGRWALVSGSSYAAAQVSGLFALLRQRNPRVQSSGALVTARAGGRAIDACATLLGASGHCDGCTCAQPARVSSLARP